MVDAPVTVESAVSGFGAAVTAKFSSPSAQGEPEDQVRSPLEGLFADLSDIAGLRAGDLTMIGESSLAEMHT